MLSLEDLGWYEQFILKHSSSEMFDMIFAFVVGYFRLIRNIVVQNSIIKTPTNKIFMCNTS